MPRDFAGQAAVAHTAGELSGPRCDDCSAAKARERRTARLLHIPEDRDLDRQGPTCRRKRYSAGCVSFRKSRLLFEHGASRFNRGDSVNKTEIEWIPIAEIRVVNPRSRSKKRFHDIVANIAAIGLKRPITVARRELEPDGTRYDLTCGQGRMESCRLLGETTIPAVVTDASREEQLLMSLVENIA